MFKGCDESRLKVVFFTEWYPTKENPVAGIFIREHARAVLLYNEVVVIHAREINAPIRGGCELSDSIEEGIRTIRVCYRRSPIPKITPFIRFWNIIRTFQELVKEGFTPDVIHAQIYSDGIPAVILGRLYGLPVVITEHFAGFPLHTLSRLSALAARFVIGRADLVLPVSDDLRKHIESYGIYGRFQVIPNVVNTELFYPSPARQESSSNRKRLLVVALLTPVKGIPYLLQALHQLQGKREDFSLDIVGDGPSREVYEQMTTDLRLAGKVTFHGLKSKPGVAEFMRRCDFFVLPSVRENLPVVLIEAMASGKPVVATRVGGIPEMIGKTVGLLVPPENVAALTDALDYMMDHYRDYSPDKIARYAQERYSYEVVGKKLDDVYRRLSRGIKSDAPRTL